MTWQIFKDRSEAGQALAKALENFRDDNPIILALPRGGLPLGYEVAKALHAPLDIVLVRKIGTPASPELAAGAVVDGDDPQLVLNENIIEMYNISPEYIEEQKVQKLKEIEHRREMYRSGRPPLSIEGRTIIVIDDGIATGATVRAALKGLRKKNPKKLVLAIPVAPAEILPELDQEIDEVICLQAPSPFYAVGGYYQDFTPVEDQEAIEFLERASKNLEKQDD